MLLGSYPLMKYLASGFMAILLASTFSSPASAVTIDVTTWLAPNAFGSPSYNPAVANAITGLHDGLSSYGDPSLPTHFQSVTNVRSDQVVVTGFPSWMGQADPASVFGAAYANELGNRMHFGARIDGEGSQISISQLAFSATSTDPYNALAFAFGLGAFTYNLGYQGVLKGGDGVLWTNDDTFITGGVNTQLADGLVMRGPGNSFAAYCPGCTVEQQQAAILDVARYPGTDFQFTGNYTLGGASGSGTFNIAPVPEPATWALMLLGFGGAGAMLRRRKQVMSLA